MDPKTVGGFIAAIRKEKGITQKSLAEELYLSEKTVSKWENGRGLPDVSLLLPLCRALEVDLNELVVGHRIAPTAYRQNAEENLVRHLNKVAPRTKYVITTVAALITILLTLLLILFAGFTAIPDWQRAFLVVAGLGFLITIISLILIIAGETEIYECRHCGCRFVPSMRAYIFAPHTLRTRHLRCPSCHRRGWHRFSINKK